MLVYFILQINQCNKYKNLKKFTFKILKLKWHKLLYDAIGYIKELFSF